jgi:haloacetate dehalogenase
VLLLHGFPETHYCWHRIAPALAEGHRVIVCDLKGYGETRGEPGGPLGEGYSNRDRAAELVEVMARLDFERFSVVGHDRGGRVAYRMALDHPEAVSALAALDIVPTGEIWARADDRFALGYWHWPFLAQPAPLPERLIVGDPDGFWITAERMGIKPGDERFPDATIAAYREQLVDPGFVTASCEDYRAGATVDRAHDDADRGTRTIACPVRVLWGAEGALPRFYEDPLEAWRPFAPHATGRAVANAGHFLAEDAPEDVAADLLAFFAGGT